MANEVLLVTEQPNYVFPGFHNDPLIQPTDSRGLPLSFNRQFTHPYHLFMLYPFYLIAIGIAVSTSASHFPLQSPIWSPNRVEWIKQHLATKSPYTAEAFNASSLYLEDSCQIVQYHSVIRHGTRWPTVKDTAAVKNVISRLLSSQSEQVRWLSGWKDPFTFEKAGYLHMAGQEELYSMGQRIAMRYRELLNSSDYDLDEVQFASGAQSRTSKSGSAFHLGLLEQTGPLTSAAITPVAWTTYPKANDSYMQMSHTCPRWISEVSDNPNTTYQAHRWIETMISPIATRLSEDLGVELTVDHVDSIYTACAFETSFYRSHSNWCDLLTDNDILALEYTDDLAHYYKYSYGSDINQWVASALMEKLMHTLGDANAPKMSFQFGHSQTVLFLQTLLGLNRDAFKLRADTPIEHIQQREFKTSQMSSFAANIGFEMHNCNGSLYIRTLLSEKEVKLPRCSQSICSFDTFKAWMNEKLERGYNAICNVN